MPPFEIKFTPSRTPIMNRSEFAASLALEARANGDAWQAGKHWTKPARRAAQGQQRQRRSIARALSSLRAMFKAGK